MAENVCSAFSLPQEVIGAEEASMPCFDGLRVLLRLLCTHALVNTLFLASTAVARVYGGPDPPFFAGWHVQRMCSSGIVLGTRSQRHCYVQCAPGYEPQTSTEVCLGKY